MGIPAPISVLGFGIPPAGDKANAVVSGTFTAVGPGIPFAFYGPFNVVIYASSVTALTATSGSSAFSVVSGAGLAPGNSINSALVPAGTTIASFSGTTGTLAFPTISQTGNISPATTTVTDLHVTTGLLGASVRGVGIPPGTTVSAILSPAVTFNDVVGHPGTIQLSAAPTLLNSSAPLTFTLTPNSVVSGTDTSATFTGTSIDYVGETQLERSFDGGHTWIARNSEYTDNPATWISGASENTFFREPEKGVLYRVNCVAYTSGTINYRLSASGAAASSLSVASSI